MTSNPPAETGPARQGSTERCANPGCGHTKRDHSGRADHRERHGALVAGDPWCHACKTECLYEPPAAAPAVFPEPPSRAAVLRWAADELGRMDYDTDSQDYGYDTYRDAWNGGVMDGAEKLRRLAVEAHGTGTQQPEAVDDEGDDLVCVDECGCCDACGMEPFGTPAEGWREAARFLRRTARASGDRAGALHGARLIEAELRRLAAEAQQQTEPEAPCCSDPTCTCVQVNAEGRCDCTKWGARPAPVEPAAADSEETRHTCGNCEGVDPDTCLTNPDRPAEPPV